MNPDPLLAKSIQNVQHSLWPEISRLHRPSRSGEVQAHWCQPWVSVRPAIQESTARFGRPAACNLIRRSMPRVRPVRQDPYQVRVHRISSLYARVRRRPAGP